MSPVLNGMFDHVVKYYAGKGTLSKGAGILCAVAALEMAGRVIVGRCKGETYDLSPDLSGTLFYGLCAYPVIPGVQMLGGTVLVGKALWDRCLNSPETQKKNYFLLQVIGATPRFAYDYFLALPVRTTWNWGVVPLFKHIISPVALAIKDACAALFQLINIREHPTWYAVGTLVVAAVAARQFGWVK